MAHVVIPMEKPDRYRNCFHVVADPLPRDGGVLLDGSLFLMVALLPLIFASPDHDQRRFITC